MQQNEQTESKYSLHGYPLAFHVRLFYFLIITTLYIIQFTCINITYLIYMCSIISVLDVRSIRTSWTEIWPT